MAVGIKAWRIYLSNDFGDVFSYDVMGREFDVVERKRKELEENFGLTFEGVADLGSLEKLPRYELRWINKPDRKGDQK